MNQDKNDVVQARNGLKPDPSDIDAGLTSAGKGASATT
jgi:hypothetical protein